MPAVVSLLNRTIRPSRKIGWTSRGEARVPAPGEFPVQRVERRRAGEPDEVGAVGHVGLAAERVSIMNEPSLNPNAYNLGH
jgi:hypothetical protein